MITLKTLSFSGIGPFVDKQVIHVDQLGSMVQVDGRRGDTTGSSGSGKTTVFNAHDYLLGVSDLTIGVLQSRLTKDGIWVEGSYDYDGIPLVLTRSKAKGLTVQIGDDLPITGSKLAEEKLDQILGMSRDLFRKTIHKRQKEGGFFLDLGPSDTHEFLTKCLSLETESAKITVLDNEYDKIKTVTDKLAHSLISSRAGLLATQDGILSLGFAPIKGFDDSQFQEHSETLTKLTLEHGTLKTKWQKKSQELLSAHKAGEVQFAHGLAEMLTELEKERPSVETTPYDRTNIEKFEKGIAILKDKISAIKTEAQLRDSGFKTKFAELSTTKQSLDSKIKTAEKAQVEAKTIAAEIKKIRDSLCPTCEQGWATDAAQARENTLLAKVKEYKTQIAEGKEAGESLLVVQASLEELSKESKIPFDTTELDALILKQVTIDQKLKEERQKDLDHSASENKTNAAASAEFRAKETKLRSESDKRLKEYKDLNASSYSTSQETAETKLSGLAAQMGISSQYVSFVSQNRAIFEQAMSRHESQTKTFKSNEKTYQDSVNTAQKELVVYEEKLVVIEEAKKLVKSFISCSFDSALDEIGDTATKIIRAIPNMANATIQLQGTKETLKGKIKEEVTAVISMNGELDIPIKSLSGGERSSVDLAVDLAVIDLIHTKSGKGMNIFVLDEPFNGLDPVSVEMALEVLQQANSNKKIIIVDHSSETKEMIPERIMVIRNGSTSNILIT